MLRKWKSSSAHERLCRCNMSLKHVPATFSQVCQLCYMSLLHSPATCPVSVYLTRCCPRYILQQHVPATRPLVWAHLYATLCCTRKWTKKLSLTAALPNVLGYFPNRYSSESNCIVSFLLKSVLANWYDRPFAKQLVGKATTILYGSLVRTDWKLLFLSPWYNRSKLVLIELIERNWSKSIITKNLAIDFDWFPILIDYRLLSILIEYWNYRCVTS